MFDNPRIFRRSDPDFPTTRALQEKLIAAGRVEAEGPLAPGRPASQRCRVCGVSLDQDPKADRLIPACGTCKTRSEARGASGAQPARAFTEAERSLIRKLHALLPPTQLLALLNERLRGDLGPDAVAYTAELLHAEMAVMPGAKPAAEHGWAGLRKLLTQARRDGTLDQITEPLIHDFAVVFSLSPRQLMRLKDILLQQPED